MGAAMVLGENIGTTITANIAASVAKPNAKRAALAHTLFNVFGVIWALALFNYFTDFVGWIISCLGLPNPADMAYGAVIDPTSPESTSALYGLSMFHTLFNLFNTCILIWFIPQIERIVTTVIKDKPKSEDDLVKLKYISAGHLSTAEISIGQAKNEVIHFAKISRNGLGYIREAIRAEKADDFELYRQKLVKYEEIADRIDYEIAAFLNAMPQESISEHTRKQSKAMYKIIGELESLGDSGEAISRILTRRNTHGKSFTPEQIANIESLLTLVDNAYAVMIENLTREEVKSEHIKSAVACEVAINDHRTMLREEEIHRIEEGDSCYHSSVYYIDVLVEIERMGDYIINISEALQ